jgi:hypothetical protein
LEYYSRAALWSTHALDHGETGKVLPTMDRLQSELERLYLVGNAEGHTTADGRTRAIVLEFAAPTAWQDLSRLWQGVQADLALPPPAIAVNGRDACQLWFSLAEPVTPGQADTFIASLRARYLAGVPAERVRNASPATLPPTEIGPERWSAFVAPDLAPLFAEEPWLDQPPGHDAQADLLSRFASVPPQAFVRACASLASAPHPSAAPSAAPAGSADPRAFLLSVMQDPAVDLRLRIEAAKALL